MVPSAIFNGIHVLHRQAIKHRTAGAISPLSTSRDDFITIDDGLLVMLVDLSLKEDGKLRTQKLMTNWCEGAMGEVRLVNILSIILGSTLAPALSGGVLYIGIDTHQEWHDRTT